MYSCVFCWSLLFWRVLWFHTFKRIAGYEPCHLFCVSGDCAPTAAVPGTRCKAGSPLAPAAASTAHPSTSAQAVSVAYATSPTQPHYCSESLSVNEVSRFRAAWEDLTPSLDHHDIILSVNLRFIHSLALLPPNNFWKRSICRCSLWDSADSGRRLDYHSQWQRGFQNDPWCNHG